MSYIAFDLDALNVAPAAARAAGVSEDNIIGGLARLWAWCFRQEVDVVTSLHLVGHFGSDVSEALVAFGFLEGIDSVDGGGYRVKGAERYLKVRRAQRQGAATTNAKRPLTARSTARSPHGDRPLNPRPTPSTEHRAPSTEKEEAALRALPEPAGPPPEPQPPAPERVPTEPEALWRQLQALRIEAGLVEERPPAPRSLSTWVSEALGHLAGDEARLLEAYRRWLADGYVRKAGGPWRLWCRQWATFVPAEAPGPKPPETPPAWEGADPMAVGAFKRHLEQLERDGAAYAAGLLRRLRPSRGSQGELVLESPDPHFALYVAGDLANALPAGARVVGPKAGAA